jgi:hypothetical protein
MLDLHPELKGDLLAHEAVAVTQLVRRLQGLTAPN